MTEMETILKDKHSGSTIIREDNQGVVLRNKSGGIEKVSNAQAHNYSVTAGERSNRQHNSDMAAKARELNRQENEVTAQRKAAAQAEISADVQRKRDNRDANNKLGSNYNV